MKHVNSIVVIYFLFFYILLNQYIFSLDLCWLPHVLGSHLHLTASNFFPLRYCTIQVYVYITCIKQPPDCYTVVSFTTYQFWLLNTGFIVWPICSDMKVDLALKVKVNIIIDYGWGCLTLQKSS